MSSGLGTQPTATTYDVEQLAKWAWEGRIRIPHFQRPLRWQRDDVIRLFDSILRGYPVGSLLLWHRPAKAERVHLGALLIEAPKLADALWVVDGQQRITGLANALHPDARSDDRFRISYDLRKKMFVPAPRDSSRGDVIPLPVIFDLREVLRWSAEHPEVIDRVNEINEITQAIRQFKIPAYEVSQEDPAVLEDIFDRLNNYGKRLTRAEVFSALNAGEEDDRKSTLDGIAQSIALDLEFGFIDSGTVMQAILARRGPDVQREIRNEFDGTSFVGDFPGEDRDTAYSQGELALRRAVSFLQFDVGVPHFTMLPYKYPLVVLARLFAHHPDLDERSRQLVRRWFWRAVVVGPTAFRGNTTGAVREMNRAVVPRDHESSVQGLLDLISHESARMPDLKRFRSNEAATKIALCSWWSLEPRSLATGRPFNRRDLAECIADYATPAYAVQHLVWRDAVSRERRPWAANRLLYPETDYGAFTADVYVFTPHARKLGQPEWERALMSHGITTEAAALAGNWGALDDFLSARQRWLENQLESFLRQRCEWDFEDTPPLDSLVLEDEGEAEELSDDESAGLR